MRVLLIAPYFPPYLGGQERYVYCLSRELVRLGHQVCVLTANVPRSARAETIDGIEVVRHTCLVRPLRNAIIPGLAFTSGRFRAFDLIHAHNERAFATNVAVLLKLRLRLPLVITCHGHGGSMFNRLLLDSLEKAYTATVGKATLACADRITVATPSEKAFLISLGLAERRISVVPVGIDLGAWDSYATTNMTDFMHKHGLEGRRVILFATQIIRRKGLEYLIRAMPIVLAVFPNAICFIAGSGDYMVEAQKLVQELGLSGQVRFGGYLKDPDLAMAYRNSEVFVLPSLAEGQPTCMMEAFAFSLPVVATDIDGTRDYFSECALLVPPRDPEALGRAIVKLLANRAMAKDMGRRGRALVESRFDWKQVARDMVEVYGGVAG